MSTSGGHVYTLSSLDGNGRLNLSSSKQFWKSLKYLNKQSSSVIIFWKSLKYLIFCTNPKQSEHCTDPEKASILNSYFNECFNHTAPLISLKYSALAQCMSDTTLFLVSLNFAKWSGLPDFLALLNSVFRHLIDFTRFLFSQGKLWRRGGSTLLGMLSSIIELFHFTQQPGFSQNFENNSYRWKWNQLCWKESHDENKIDKRLKPDKAGKQQKLDGLRSNFTN